MKSTDMRPGTVRLVLLGRAYDIAFTLEAIDTICGELSCKVQDIAEIIKDSGASGFRRSMVVMLAALVNCAVGIHNEEHPDEPWEEVTAKQLMRRLTNVTFAAAFEKVVDAYVLGFIADANAKDEDDISADPNPAREAT